MSADIDDESKDMKKFAMILAIVLAVSPAFAKKTHPAAPAKSASQAVVAPDSQQMETDLQKLTWPQLRFVIESVPKLKADVETYGPAGWKYVEARYATYPWKKNIDRLDDAQKRQLAELVQLARKSR